MIDIIGKRYYLFALSCLIIIPGIIGLAVWKLPLAIDFTGGSLLEIEFASGNPPQPAEVVLLYNDLGITDVQAQTSGKSTLLIRSSEINEELRGKIVDSMEKEFSDTITVLRFDTVGPTIGREVTTAPDSCSVAALGSYTICWFAFRGVQHAFRYGFVQL
jgi:preprotein translocase subunit SecF